MTEILKPDIGVLEGGYSIVFCDTDGIHESQREKIRICPDCSGTCKIDSTSDRGSHIMAVYIPRNACRKCKDLGYKWFDMVFLQGRIEDKCLQHDFRK